MRDRDEKLVALVRWLADEYAWNWTRGTDQRAAADAVLERMVELGLIEGRHHPLTISRRDTVFRVGGQLFGRTDGIDHSLFDKPEPKNSQTIERGAE